MLIFIKKKKKKKYQYFTLSLALLRLGSMNSAPYSAGVSFYLSVTLMRGQNSEFQSTSHTHTHTQAVWIPKIVKMSRFISLTLSGNTMLESGVEDKKREKNRFFSKLARARALFFFFKSKNALWNLAAPLRAKGKLREWQCQLAN